jgi:hypothetical protein
MALAMAANGNSSKTRKPPLGKKKAAPRSESEKMKVETLDMEKQLDQLRLQMAMEKEKQATLG